MVDFDVKSVISRIEVLLAEKQMLKEEFYSKSGISSASYSQWNTLTHKPTKKKLAAAANCLGVSLEYLLYGSEQKETPAAESSERDEDPDIYRIERARKNMTEKDREKMMKILIASFEDYFSDDYVDEDIDE